MNHDKNAEKNDATLKMKTLLESVNESVAKGYTENFKVTARGLATADDRAVYKADEISISNFYRFEGHSDPQDNSILYQIETNDGRKGLLIDAYGADADAKVASFIRDVEDIHKKNKN